MSKRIANRPEDIPAGDGQKQPRSAHVDLQAEAAVLGAILLVGDTFYDISDILRPEDFASRQHQEIFAAMVECGAEGMPFDVITVGDVLRRRKTLDKAGGREYLEQLTLATGDVENAQVYAKLVAEKALLRNLARTGQEITRTALAVDAVAENVLEEAESQIYRLGDRREAHRYVEMPEAVAELMAELAEARTSTLVGHTTGLATLDDMTMGLQGGQLVLLAARPSIGKSALALSIARTVAETSGEYVIFESYEMGRTELMMRMLSSATGLSMTQLRIHDFPPEAEADITKHATRLQSIPMLIDDNPPRTISGLRTALRREARRRPIAMVVIDYLQLIEGERRENRNTEVSEVSRTLKLLAREFDIPILALSQLNRAVENRGGRPTLADLRDSGSLEQDADVVLFISRDPNAVSVNGKSPAELIIAKQRNGPIGVIEVEFDGAVGRWKDKGRTQTTHTPPPPSQGSGQGGNGMFGGPSRGHGNGGGAPF